MMLLLKKYEYRSAYNNRPSNSMSLCLLLLPPLAAFTVSLCAFYFCKTHRETDRFCAASGVEHARHNQHQFRFRRAAFYSQLKSKVGNILAKATALRINLIIDGAPVASHTHTPLPLTNFSCLIHFHFGIPFPRST